MAVINIIININFLININYHDGLISMVQKYLIQTTNKNIQIEIIL